MILFHSLSITTIIGGGRVLWFFLEVILLKTSISAYKIVQSIFTLGIYYLIYKIASKISKNNNWRLALFTMICFLLTDLMIIRDSYYWFTASVLYLLPILPVFLIIYLTMEKDRKLLINILCIILAFIAAWSQEQVSVFIVSYLGLLTLFRIITDKKLNKWDILITLGALLGFAILMLAPGSKARMNSDTAFYSLDIIHKMIKNIPIIVVSNFGDNTKIFTVLFFTSSLYYMFINRNKFKYKFIIDIGIINSMALILFNILFASSGYHEKLYMIMMGITLLQLLIILLCLYKDNKPILFIIFTSAILSQAAMIMAPYFPMRSATMFEISYYIIFIYIISILLKNNKLFTNYLLIVLTIMGIYNYYTITEGYSKNYEVKVANEKILKAASKKIKKGKNIKIIKIKRCDQIYGVVEPDGIEYYIKRYYDIPVDVSIVYDN